MTRLLTTLALSFALAMPALAQTKWDVPTAYPANNFHTENLQQFANDVDKATNGKLKLQLHPNASLFKAPEIKRAVQGGQAQAGEILLVNYENEDSLYGLDGVPFLATSYKDAYTRSQAVIRERLLPMAKDLKVVIAVEEVWNKFLLSPLEFARYVDEFQSPWVKAYFDVGNIVFYAFPQDWIRTLGPRIVKIHLKDFKLDRRSFNFTNLGEGDIDWPEVRRALNDIKYGGFVTTELSAGDPPGNLAYLKDVSARVDRILAGEKPV